MSLPQSHPRAAEQICEICCYVVDHPEGLIVVDTGPRSGHPLIDELYAPDVAPITSVLAADGELIADGVRVLHTPGHSPGHLSVAAQTDRGLEIVVGQACYSCAEFAAATTTADDMHDPAWHSVGMESVARLRSLNPARAHFSHDAQPFGA